MNATTGPYDPGHTIAASTMVHATMVTMATAWLTSSTGHLSSSTGSMETESTEDTGSSEVSAGSEGPSLCTDEKVAHLFGCLTRVIYVHPWCLCSTACGWDACMDECRMPIEAEQDACRVKYPLCAEVIANSWQACHAVCADDQSSCTMAAACSGGQANGCYAEYAECWKDCE